RPPGKGPGRRAAHPLPSTLPKFLPKKADYIPNLFTVVDKKTCHERRSHKCPVLLHAGRVDQRADAQRQFVGGKRLLDEGSAWVDESARDYPVGGICGGG